MSDKSRNITSTKLEASVSRVIYLPIQGRISFQLTEADGEEFSRRLIRSSCTLSMVKKLRSHRRK